ncbi:hypothetical protein V4C29_23900 [Bacillus cereus]|jgi:hypothetical protein|uniref:hypothetical protein n=1 Tax=Bacillus cereus TaxID=1396 RepID=UPI002FE453BD|nr:hypothetical protein [Bacillus cereus]
MARSGKGDLADYGDNLKKEKPKIPGFSDVADSEELNQKQEIKEGEEKPTIPDVPTVEEVVENNNEDEPEVKEENEPEIKQEPEIEEENKNEHIHDKFTEQFLEQFNKKVTKEDTHTRQTWLIKNETVKRLEKLSKGKRKGFKTELVNQAIEMILDRIEK